MLLKANVARVVYYTTCEHYFITHKTKMPSVADELAELRRRSITKSHAEKLKDANGLSTPEQEAEALKEAKHKTHSLTYTKDAVETLKAGSKAVLDQDLDFKVQQSAKKKQDLLKQREASQRNNAGTKAVDQDLDFKVQQTLKKKEDMEKAKEATRNLQSFKNKLDAAGAATTRAGPYGTTTSKASEPAEAVVKQEHAASEEDKDAEEIPDMEDVPELEAVQAETVDTVFDDAPMPAMIPPSGPRVPNRNEKKARKVMERLGMQPVLGISRVTLKMQGGGSQGFFTIHQPDVFEKNGSYIVFGEAKQGMGMPPPRLTQQQQQMQAAQRLASMVEEKKTDEPSMMENEQAVDEHVVVDESGVDAKDIDLVISQAGCTRARAVKALKENDGDLVNAIMSLTS